MFAEQGDELFGRPDAPVVFLLSGDAFNVGEQQRQRVGHAGFLTPLPGL